MRPLQRALGEEDAVRGEDPDREALDVAEPADQGLAVERLELVKVAAVDDAGDDLADVVALRVVGGDDPVEVGRVVERLGRRRALPRRLGRAQAQVRDDLADEGERVLALGIAASLNAPIPETTFGVFRM